jgi:hypothetical protein
MLGEGLIDRALRYGQTRLIYRLAFSKLFRNFVIQRLDFQNYSFYQILLGAGTDKVKTL